MAKIKFLDDTGKMEVTYEDHEKALHEAGHAVIAEALGLQVTGISLERVAVRAKAGSKEWAMIALAGKRAQQMANDKCQWSELGAESELIPTMSPSDREMIDAYLEKFMDYERRDIEAALGFRVGRLLDENWPKVMDKAKRLMRGERPLTKLAAQSKPAAYVEKRTAPIDYAKRAARHEALARDETIPAHVREKIADSARRDWLMAQGINPDFPTYQKATLGG